LQNAPEKNIGIMLEEFEKDKEFNKSQNSIMQSSKIDTSEFDLLIGDRMVDLFFGLLEKDSEHYIVTPQKLAQIDIKSNLTETEVNKFPKFIQTIKNKFNNRGER